MKFIRNLAHHSSIHWVLIANTNLLMSMKYPFLVEMASRANTYNNIGIDNHRICQIILRLIVFYLRVASPVLTQHDVDKTT